MKTKIKAKNLWRIALCLVLTVGVFAWQAAAQTVNNMSGLYTSTQSVPITLFSCTDPDDNGDIFIISRSLSITETTPGTFSGSLTMTASTEKGDITGTFSVSNGVAPVANPRNISGMMQSTDPLLTLFNGTFGGTWGKSGTTANINMTLSGTGQTPKGSCNYVGSLPMTSTCAYSFTSLQTFFPQSGSSGTITLTTGAGCPWTVTGNNGITFSQTGGTGNMTFNYTVPANPGGLRTLVITIAGVTLSIPQGGLTVLRTPFDFDGDGKADVSTFRPSNGVWYLQQSQAGFTGMAFGQSGDTLVPADYDGDGKTDLAVYRSGIWYLQRSQLGFTGIGFGASTDIPAPADFTGDGKAELAVFRPSNGVWYTFNLANNVNDGVGFGQSGDRPVPADYDGDGKADFAVFRPSNGVWYLQRSQAGFTGLAFGDANDKTVQADYDGDGKADIAVFRPSNGTWYLQRSQAGFTGIGFGLGTDIPTPADYDGDGKADLAVFRQGIWYLQRSQAGFTGVAFGAATDTAVPNSYVR